MKKSAKNWVKMGRSYLLYVGVGMSEKKQVKVGRNEKQWDGVGMLILVFFFHILKKYYLCFALVTKNSLFVTEILDLFVFLCNK